MEVAKLGKEAIASLLAPAKEIIAILDVLAQIHPAVQVRDIISIYKHGAYCGYETRLLLL